MYVHINMYMFINLYRLTYVQIYSHAIFSLLLGLQVRKTLKVDLLIFPLSAIATAPAAAAAATIQTTNNSSSSRSCKARTALSHVCCLMQIHIKQITLCTCVYIHRYTHIVCIINKSLQ